MSAPDEAVAATWSEHSATGHHYEDLLADGRVISWTEPPFGETLDPGEDDPDYNPICRCPGPWPRSFCLQCAGCTACSQCDCHSPLIRLVP
ncbi:hypothetical protein [Streptomyces sp. NPDC059788]|uniref:hypothetical protein n=1 Tax=Streptomyces sp. NPDC059788 TaxID=3346948 RepID=UPI00364AFB4F